LFDFIGFVVKKVMIVNMTTIFEYE
jgi:hypothetical protein